MKWIKCTDGKLVNLLYAHIIYIDKDEYIYHTVVTEDTSGVMHPLFTSESFEECQEFVAKLEEMLK